MIEEFQNEDLPKHMPTKPWRQVIKTARARLPWQGILKIKSMHTKTSAVWPMITVNMLNRWLNNISVIVTPRRKERIKSLTNCLVKLMNVIYQLLNSGREDRASVQRRRLRQLTKQPWSTQSLKKKNFALNFKACYKVEDKIEVIKREYVKANIYEIIRPGAINSVNGVSLCPYTGSRNYLPKKNKWITDDGKFESCNLAITTTGM